MNTTRPHLLFGRALDRAHKVLCALALFFVPFTGFAQSGKWALDRVHSGITFSVAHMVIAEATGRFDDFTLNVLSDKEDFSDAKIDVVIKVASVNTDNKRRDDHLRTSEFFDAAQYPEIIFKSREMKPVGDKKYKLLGDFTMKGVTKPIELDVRFGGFIKDKQGKMRAGFKVTGVINRQDYGVKWNSLLDNGGATVGDEVELRANLELVKQ
jgi:polyisoprenoid-binding protein YceI